ncbi:MAG: oligosaccharide flippase family protein [Bacteroidia bacterium]|nr:oligosaccharide flippase family protein [Bacteroidia bacterium]
MIKLSFIKDSLLYTIGNALPMMASIILLPFYVHFLKPEYYVALSFYIGISLLFQTIFSFSFEQYYGVVYTEIKHSNEKIKILNGSIFIYLIVYGSAIILLTLLFGDFILNTIFDKDIPVTFYPYGLLSVITGFLNALFKVSMATYIYTQKSKVFFYSNLINFFATLTISLLGLFLYPDTLAGPVYGRFLSGIIILFFNLWILKDNIHWQYEHRYIKEFLQKSWTLFAYSIVIWITGNVDRYFLKNYIDVKTLASYDLIMKCFIGIEFIQNGLSMAIISKVFDIWKKNEKVELTMESNRYFNVFIFLNTMMIVIFVFILPFFIRLVVKEEHYYAAFELIGLIASTYLLRSILYPYNFIYLYSKKTLHFFLINALGIGLQTLLYFFFTPLYGILAVLFINVLIRILSVISFHLHVSYRIASLKVNYLKWYFIPVSAVVFYFVSFYFFSHQYIKLNAVILMMFLIFSMGIYFSELRQFWNDIRNKIFAQS